MDRERTGDICHPVHRRDARLPALRSDAARNPARSTSALNASPKSAGVLAQLEAGRARPQRPKPMTRAYTRALSGRTKAGVWFGAHDTLAADGGCRTKGSVRPGQEHSGMAQNFIESRREQGFLLPPDVREWLPADHLAWFVIDTVAEMDLAAFYRAYRADGHGRAAYEPSLMVALVLYAFAGVQRSSRAIERHCRQDVAYRVITGNLIPDHATIARFIGRHERALADLFGDVLRLCDRVGLVKPGVVSIDGTRIAGNASPEVNHEFDRIAR